ncbi:MAG: hypothetical protein JXM70_10045 [Pirellulales bacterium]|nr:hypothetical protein [Pirellulales bacterium]
MLYQHDKSSHLVLARLQIVTLLIALFTINLTCVTLLCAQEKPAPARAKSREATPAVVNPVLRSDLRANLSLDGQWDFVTDPDLKGEAQGWYKPEVKWPATRKIRVPGCWEAQGVGKPGPSNPPGHLLYEPVNVQLRSAYTGAAWYKTKVCIPKDWAGKQIWLKIGGVNSQGWFWLNGTYIGHEYTFCGTYKYNVTDLVKPGNEAILVVLARNDVPSRRGESNCLRMYGGIFRSVELDATPDIFIDNVFVEPLLDEKKARVHIALRNTTGAASKSPFRTEIDVRTAKDLKPVGKADKSVTVTAKEITDLIVDVDLDPLVPWSPENPFLYTANVKLLEVDRPIDGWIERFGVKKYEVRGGDLYLNNRRFFTRCYGDDHVYPMTVCSSASREEHARHMQIAKNYGFNYVRHHTHCEIPEFYEAADEVGIMVQPELPYYGRFSEKRPYSHLSGAPLTPKKDLEELVTHYRRYTSLSTYCGGNEGDCLSPLDRELYQLAHQLDDSRPWVSMDGSPCNTQKDSDVNNWWGGGAQVHPPMKENVWPHTLHEFMSLGINEDPRLEPKFTGAFAANLSLKDVKHFVENDVGLSWDWAQACFDAGHRIQGVHHKIGIESARVDRFLDGFSCWLMTDISPSSQNGVVNMFWETKSSTPEYFREFNSPTIILACPAGGGLREALSLKPGSLIRTGGDAMDIDWVVSHFESDAIKDGTLKWRLEADGKILVQGHLKNIHVAAGDVAIVGHSNITLPWLEKAVLARLIVELEGTDTHNSWKIYLFPNFQPKADSGRGMALSADIYEKLSARYSGASKLGSKEAANTKLVVAASLDESGVVDALDRGCCVVCLSLPGYNLISPGVSLGWWQITNQTGTAIARHPAFGDYPHEGYLDQGMFRLIHKAEKLDPGHKFRNVEPLMVGIGRATGYKFGFDGYPLGFNLYTFQANAGKGKLLSTGLNLLSDHPEAVHLLDQFIEYARSEKFRPKGDFGLNEFRKKLERIKKISADLNGWGEIVRAGESVRWHTFLRTDIMYTARQTDGRSEVVWKTDKWKPDKNGLVHFKWIANIGWITQPAGGHFTMYLNGKEILTFDVSHKHTTWTGKGAACRLKFTVKNIDRKEDASGIMELIVPGSLLKPGGKPVELRVVGSANNSKRYFGLQPNP